MIAQQDQGNATELRNIGGNWRRRQGELRGYLLHNAANGRRSASEITNILLVPKTQDTSTGLDYPSVEDVYKGLPAMPATYDQTKEWWEGYKPTGDNLREGPYNQIYPRVTTKSNTFRVHYRVQTLQKRRTSGEQDVWVEGADRVLGELRGSALIERYLDPNANNIPDYADDQTDDVPLQSFYRWRVISEQQFRP